MSPLELREMQPKTLLDRIWALREELELAQALYRVAERQQRSRRQVADGRARVESEATAARQGR